MDPSLWKLVKELFEQARGMSPAGRQTFLQTANITEDVREEVRSMLQVYEESAGFMEAPVSMPAEVVEKLVSKEQRFGPYRVVRRIGAGGMGDVYEGERVDGEFRQRVAIKVITSASDAEFLETLFRRERQILADLAHPNIARLLDGGRTADGTPYFVMEYIDGVPLDEYCHAGGLDIAARVRLLLAVCNAVSYAHEQNVIHRDLKPGNILVTAEGVPKLMDFGIAKPLEAGGMASNSMWMGTRLATPAYASPEHLDGRELTQASDVFSLGCVIKKVLPAAPPKRLVLIAEKASAETAELRYRTVKELAQELERVLRPSLLGRLFR